MLSLLALCEVEQFHITLPLHKMVEAYELELITVDRICLTCRVGLVALQDRIRVLKLSESLVMDVLIRILDLRKLVLLKGLDVDNAAQLMTEELLFPDLEGHTRLYLGNFGWL